MKIRIFATAIVIALIVAGLAWGLFRTAPPAAAVAAIDDPHAGHDHGSEKESAPHPGEEVDDLFAEEDHEDHAGEVDPHAGHGHGDPGEEDEFCPEHRVAEAEDALCHGDLIGELLPGQGMKVRLAAVDAAVKAGVTLSRVQTLSLAEGSAIPGRVAFNRGRLARITPLASGVVRRVRVRTGASVAKGDIVAEIAMPEIAALKSQFLAARAREAQTEATYRQEEILLQRGISSRRAFQEAEAQPERLGAVSPAAAQLRTLPGRSPAARGRRGRQRRRPAAGTLCRNGRGDEHGGG
jgi:cobalt-zinc-cadmium efflux system membrane fusion protein